MLKECKSRLIGRRKELNGLTSQRDVLVRTLREAEVDFLRLGVDWRRLETELEEVRSNAGSPDMSALGSARQRYRSAPTSAERFASGSRRGRDRAVQSPLDDELGHVSTPGKRRVIRSLLSSVSPLPAAEQELSGLRRWLPSFTGRRRDPNSSKRRSKSRGREAQTLTASMFEGAEAAGEAGQVDALVEGDDGVIRVEHVNAHVTGDRDDGALLEAACGRASITSARRQSTVDTQDGSSGVAHNRHSTALAQRQSNTGAPDASTLALMNEIDRQSIANAQDMLDCDNYELALINEVRRTSEMRRQSGANTQDNGGNHDELALVEEQRRKSEMRRQSRMNEKGAQEAYELAIMDEVRRKSEMHRQTGPNSEDIGDGCDELALIEEVRRNSKTHRPRGVSAHEIQAYESTLMDEVHRQSAVPAASGDAGAGVGDVSTRRSRISKAFQVDPASGRRTISEDCDDLEAVLQGTDRRRRSTGADDSLQMGLAAVVLDENHHQHRQVCEDAGAPFYDVDPVRISVDHRQMTSELHALRMRGSAVQENCIVGLGVMDDMRSDRSGRSGRTASPWDGPPRSASPRDSPRELLDVEVSVREVSRSPVKGDGSPCHRTIAAWELLGSHEHAAGNLKATLLGGAFAEGAFRAGPSGGFQIQKPAGVGPVTITLWEQRLGQVCGDHCVLSVGPASEGVIFSYKPQPGFPGSQPGVAGSQPFQVSGGRERASRGGFVLGDLRGGEVMAPAGAVAAISSADERELAVGSTSLARAGWNHHAFVLGLRTATWYINGTRAVVITRDMMGDSFGLLTVGNSADLRSGDQSNMVLMKRVVVYDGEFSARDAQEEYMRGSEDFEWAARQQSFVEERRLLEGSRRMQTAPITSMVEPTGMVSVGPPQPMMVGPVVPQLLLAHGPGSPMMPQMNSLDGSTRTLMVAAGQPGSPRMPQMSILDDSTRTLMLGVGAPGQGPVMTGPPRHVPASPRSGPGLQLSSGPRSGAAMLLPPQVQPPSHLVPGSPRAARGAPIPGSPVLRPPIVGSPLAGSPPPPIALMTGLGATPPSSMTLSPGPGAPKTAPPMTLMSRAGPPMPGTPPPPMMPGPMIAGLAPGQAPAPMLATAPVLMPMSPPMPGQWPLGMHQAPMQPMPFWPPQGKAYPPGPPPMFMGPPPPGTTWEAVAAPPASQFLGSAPGQFGLGSPPAPPPPVGLTCGLLGPVVPSPAASYAPPQTAPVVALVHPSPRAVASAATILPNAEQPQGTIIASPVSLGREVTLPAPPAATFMPDMPPRAATPEEMLPTDIDMLIAEFMAREPLPRELIRLGPGNYVYGGERVDINVHTRASGKPKLKATNTRFNAGQPVSLRRFANLFEEQLTPAPSPEKAERHSVMGAAPSSDMKMEGPREIMLFNQSAPSSEAVLTSKLAEVERRVALQLAEQPSKTLAIEGGRRSRISSAAVPTQAPMALEAPEMRRDPGMVMAAGGSRSRSQSVGAAVASRPSVSWRERLESAPESFAIQEQRSRSASLAPLVSTPGGPMLAIAGPVTMPMPGGSGGGAIRQRSASVCAPSPRSEPDPLGRSRSATVGHDMRMAAPLRCGSVSVPLGVQLPLGVPTALSPRSSAGPLGVTVPALQSSAPMLANAAGRQNMPLGRGFTFAKPQGRATMTLF